MGLSVYHHAVEVSILKTGAKISHSEKVWVDWGYADTGGPLGNWEVQTVSKTADIEFVAGRGVKIDFAMQSLEDIGNPWLEGKVGESGTLEIGPAKFEWAIKPVDRDTGSWSDNKVWETYEIFGSKIRCVKWEQFGQGTLDWEYKVNVDVGIEVPGNFAFSVAAGSGHTKRTSHRNRVPASACAICKTKDGKPYWKEITKSSNVKPWKNVD